MGQWTNTNMETKNNCQQLGALFFSFQGVGSAPIGTLQPDYTPSLCLLEECIHQEIGRKGKEMALVWHEKASRTKLQTSSVNLTHTLLVQTHNMTTVKEIAEQCCQI